MLDPAFARLLASEGVEQLEAAPDTVYGVWSDWRLGYANPAWDHFAQGNGGAEVLRRWPLGADLRTAISAELWAMLAPGFEGALRSGAPWAHRYECSSPGIFREFQLIAFPLQGQGLLLVHRLVEERPHQRLAGEAGATWRNENGHVVQCSYCRCLRRHGTDEWVWVPEVVAKPVPETTHSICPTCLLHYFPA